MQQFDGFLKADGRRLVDGAGREVLLRGVGLGGWLLPEGYMWNLPDGGDRPRKIEKMIVDLLGQEQADAFWAVYFDRYTAEADIRQIAQEGFNSVRIPINGRLLASGGTLALDPLQIGLIDRAIGWCRNHGLWVILDLHAAPGGQTGANIDDSEHDRPELFEQERNKDVTVALWRMLAERYSNETAVAGYDLLNEPLPDWFSEYNSGVMPLYKRITDAIRKVDKNHTIILEGVHWATGWSIFDEAIDGNLMLQFHKYWNNPETESIQPYLDKRDELNVPIFMGEGGENNKDWYAGAFRLFEDHNISWNFWTWKKMDTDNSPCSVSMPEGWQRITGFLNGGIKPDPDSAKAILWAYLDNIAFGRCSYHPEVVNSLFRRPPLRIPAVFYGYRGERASFHVSRRADVDIGFRAKDGTDIQFVSGTGTEPNFRHMRGEEWLPEEWLYVRLANKDWLAYEFVTDALHKAEIKLCLRACVMDGASLLTIELDESMAATINIIGEQWKTTTATRIFHLRPGLHRIILKTEGNPVCLQWLEFLIVGSHI